MKVFIYLWVISILGLQILVPQLAYAADVTLRVTPAFTPGILNFTITYVTDTRLDLTWGYGTEAVAVMIRAKYGTPPANIPNIHTAPSDGYLVYQGAGTSVSDTSMDFDENLGMLYYVAWAQRADGTWHMDIQSGSKESKEMELLFFLFFCLGMTWFGVKSSYYVLKFLAGATWFGLLAYWLAERPTNITAGSSTDTIIIVLFFIIGIALMFMPAWYENGQGGKFGIRIPRFLGGQSEEDEEAEREANARTWRERSQVYRDRANAAVQGRRLR